MQRELERNFRMWESRTRVGPQATGRVKRGIAADIAEAQGPRTPSWGMEWYLKVTLHNHEPTLAMSDVRIHNSGVGP